MNVLNWNIVLNYLFETVNWLWSENGHSHDLYLLISWLAARHSSSNECFLFEPDAANWLATALEWLEVPTPGVAPAEAPRPILAKTADDWSEDLLCPGDTAEPVDKAQVWQLISCHNSIIGKTLNNFVEILKKRNLHNSYWPSHILGSTQFEIKG